MSAPRELAVVVPVMYNFQGCVEMFATVDYPFLPIIIDNSINNKGVAKSWNIGLGHAMERNIGNVLIANDDVLFEPGAVVKMMDALYNRPFTSALNSRDYAPTQHEAYDDNAEFAAFMVHPKQFTNRVGFFDEHFYPAYFEDNDMARRMILAGLGEFRRTDAVMFHKGSVTQFWNGDGAGRVVSHDAFDKNKLYFKTKWGGEPGHEQFTTPFGTGDHTLKEW